MNQTIIKLGILAVAIIVAVAAYLYDLHTFLTLSNLQEASTDLKKFVNNNPVNSIAIAFFAMTVIYMLPLPAAALLSLIAGYLFGFKNGFLLVSSSSLIAATLTFLLARYVARDFITKHFSSYIEKLNNEMNEDGFLYSLSIRLIPGIPFIALNSALGITSLKLKDFISSTWLGMLPISAVLINAGNQFNEISSIKDVMTPNMLISLLLIASTPILIKWLVSKFSSEQKKEI